MLIQQKIGRPVQFEITADTRASLLAWLERRGGSVDDFAFPSRVDPDEYLSTRQYARLVDGTHSLRRTKAALIYKATGNLRAIEPFRSCLATPRLKTLFDTSGSTSMTH